MKELQTMEQQAREKTLQPLADYVVKIGMSKGLEKYSKTEIEGLIKVVTDSYKKYLNELLEEDVPF
ncbi:MAG: DUF6511 domain-containing protein [Parvularculales bacterium]